MKLSLNQISPLVEMGITLKFTETDLFLLKMNYLYICHLSIIINFWSKTKLFTKVS